MAGAGAKSTKTVVTHAFQMWLTAMLPTAKADRVPSVAAKLVARKQCARNTAGERFVALGERLAHLYRRHGVRNHGQRLLGLSYLEEGRRAQRGQGEHFGLQGAGRERVGGRLSCLK